MGCISRDNLCPASGDDANVLLQKILQSINQGGGVAGVSSISVNGGAPQTGAVSISTGGTVTSVNGDPGPAVSLDSGEIPEGSNQYFTVARVRATDLTGLVPTAGTVVATDTILQAFGKVAGTTNDLLNFRDTNSHADASIYINSGATEIVKVIGASAFISLATERLQRNIDSGKIALLGGIAKGSGSYIELHGDTSVGNVGLVQIITKGRATGEGNFRIFNAAVGSGSADVRAEMRYWGDWTLSPVWNDGATTFGGLTIAATDTASAAATLLADFRTGGTSRWKVTKAGVVTQLGSLNITGGTITAMEPLIDMTRTWNNAGVVFTSIRANITNTASAATSLLMDLQVGGVSKFNVSAAGTIRIGNAGDSAAGILVAGSVNGFRMGTSAAAASIAAVDNTGFASFKPMIVSGTTISFAPSGVDAVRVTTTNDLHILTDAGTLTFGAGSDLFLRRDAANEMAVRRSTTPQTFRVYETESSSLANYSRISLIAAAGNQLIRTEAAGTGTLRILQVGTGPKVGTDVAGQTTIIHGGQSTGSAAGGSVLIQVSPAGGAGAGVNALATVGTFTSLGLTIAGDIASTGHVQAGATAAHYWSGRSSILSPSDGVIRIANLAGNDFNRLQFGLTTSAAPSIKRSTTFLQFRLADDSGFTGFTTGIGANAVIEVNGTGLGFFAVAPVVRQASGANLTNNVTAGGTDDTIANFTDLSVYANDAATIRNDIYQLARKLKQVNDALRLYGLLT